MKTFNIKWIKLKFCENHPQHEKNLKYVLEKTINIIYQPCVSSDHYRLLRCYRTF